MDNNMHLESTKMLLENAYIHDQVIVFHEHDL